MAVRPPELRHTYYCGPCYDEKVAAYQADYDVTLGKAREINVFFKGSKSSVRVLRKAKELVRVTDAPDRDGAILTLAFQAAHEGYNAITEVEVVSRKLRTNHRQTSLWSAEGIPSEIFSRELDR